MRLLPLVPRVGAGCGEGIGQNKGETSSGEAVTGRLVSVEDVAHVGAKVPEGRWFVIGHRPQQRCELLVVHERFAQRRDCAVAAVSRPLHESRLGEQVSEGNIKGLGE